VGSRALNTTVMPSKRSHGGDWRDVNELVPFVQTPTNFGELRARQTPPS